MTTADARRLYDVIFGYSFLSERDILVDIAAEFIEERRGVALRRALALLAPDQADAILEAISDPDRPDYTQLTREQTEGLFAELVADLRDFQRRRDLHRLSAMAADAEHRGDTARLAAIRANVRTLLSTPEVIG